MATASDSGLLARDRAHLIHSLHDPAQQDFAHVWQSGRGATLVDSEGREYLDAIAGLWNVVLGHGRTELADAAAEQMKRLAFASSYTGSTNRPAIELGERVAELCYPSIQRFFFTSGGAEANETAFKTARYYWKLQDRGDKYKIIGRHWGYHGTTLATMSATGIASYWPMFEPRTPGFLHIADPYPYRFELGEDRDASDSRTIGQRAADRLEAAILREGPETIAAFLGEPIQGPAGVIVPPDDYWPRIREICDRYDVLVIADEVVTGFGRTGDWFGLSRYDVEPDLVTFAKAISSGYVPLGGVGISDAIAEVIDSADRQHPWMHASTGSGHPVCCAVAMATLDMIAREGLLDRAAQLGRRLLARLEPLKSHPHVGDVRGIGLMAAVELVADKTTRAEFPAEEKIGPRVHAATQARGMFTRMRGDVYIFGPCYVAEEAQIDRMAEILGESIESVLGV